MMLFIRYSDICITCSPKRDVTSQFDCITKLYNMFLVIPCCLIALLTEWARFVLSDQWNNIAIYMYHKYDIIKYDVYLF